MKDRKTSESQGTAMPWKIRLTLIAAILCSTALPAFSQRPDLYVQMGHSEGVSSVAFSPDGKTLASGSADGTIQLWDVVTGLGLKTVRGSGRVESVAFSPDGKTLA